MKSFIDPIEDGTAHQMTYFSEEELLRFLEDVEAHDMVAAPVTLQQNILAQLTATTENENTEETNGPCNGEKQELLRPPIETIDSMQGTTVKRNTVRKPVTYKDYRDYCRKVAISVAAGVALVMLLPTIHLIQNDYFSGNPMEKNRFEFFGKEEIGSKEEYLEKEQEFEKGNRFACYVRDALNSGNDVMGRGAGLWEREKISPKKHGESE